MSKEFVIGNGALFKRVNMDEMLLKYRGTDTRVVVPDGVRIIDNNAFQGNKTVTSIVIPGSIRKIGAGAFKDCENLTSVTVLDGATYISVAAFRDCKNLTSVTLPDSLKQIGEHAFNGCINLNHVTIPNSVTSIGRQAFCGCTSLNHINIPEGLKDIWQGAFMGCTNLTTVIFGSNKLEHFGTGPDPFDSCNKVTIVCQEGCNIHRYCIEKNISYIFDYQYEAFHGLLPQGFEMLSSPFLADEEKPFIFISYSHKDRDTILEIIKVLYEKGWRIWYDEGLTIGDSYDKTLHEHVENCSAFLLFVTENSIKSNYIKNNEIPWAKEFNKPIIKCIVDEGQNIEIEEESVIATVSQSEIEPALEKVNCLTKGEPREAKGISVVADPGNRDQVSDDSYAYCVYSEQNAPTAKAVLHSVKNGGCNLYDAIEQGADREKLKSCACLVVFLDKAFITDNALMKTLTDVYLAGRNIAVCKSETVTEDDLPQELKQLRKVHWLNFAHGISEDMNHRLIRHLEKRGCRNTAIIPGLEYEEADEGIIITKYTGLETEPRIESAYNGKPVVEIARSAFEGCVQLKTITIPDGVKRVGVHLVRDDGLSKAFGNGAFAGCTGLVCVTFPNSVEEIGRNTFSGCTGLTSVAIPDRIEIVKERIFDGCTGLKQVIIPDGVKIIERAAFIGCTGLTSIVIPDSVTQIEKDAFRDCSGLTSVIVPDCYIMEMAFKGCKGLADENGFVVIRGELFSYHGNASSVTIPDGVKYIGKEAFHDCKSIISVNIPKSVEAIGQGAFSNCTKLSTVTIPDGVTYIGNEAFCDCKSMSSVTISNSVKEIQVCAFKKCISLTSVVIPEGVEKMGWGVFVGCTKLTSVVIPSSAKKIDLQIFEELPKLTVFCAPDSYAWKYFKGRGIRVKDSKKFLRRGLFGKK